MTEKEALETLKDVKEVVIVNTLLKNYLHHTETPKVEEAIDYLCEIGYNYECIDSLEDLHNIETVRDSQGLLKDIRKFFDRLPSEWYPETLVARLEELL